MTFVLSIIAGPPRSKPDAPGAGPSSIAGAPAVGPVLGASTPSSASIQDGNQAIDQFVGMMDKAKVKLPYKAVTERATYVRDIASILKKLKDQEDVPDIIQLIAHGSPGRLEFGSYWGEQLLDPQQGAAVLDSNSDSYGFLQKVIPQKSRVLLLGCHVGSPSPTGYVASGKALLFDLEDLTGANFYAADCLVHPALFDDGFLYRGPLVTKDGQPANPVAIARSDRSLPPLSAVRPPELVRIVSAPAFGRPDEIASNAPKIPGDFSQYVQVRLPEGLLAMAELVFEATGYRRVEAICGLRYLRAETLDGRTLYFEQPSSLPGG